MFGDIFAKADEIEFETADNAKVKISGRVEKLALKVLGIPHIGLRLRWRRISKVLKPSGSDLVLDAGCGSGVHALTLADEGKRVVGIELEKKKVTQAKKLAKKLKIDVDFRVGDLTKLKLKKKFDWVLCSDVLEHIKQDKSVLRSLSEVCEKKGVLILSVPAYNEYNKRHMKEYDHVVVGYHEDQIRKMLEDAGFEVQKVIGYSMIFSRIAWETSRRFLNNKIMAALTFYPLYALTFLEDLIPNNIRKKKSDGLLIVATK